MRQANRLILAGLAALAWSMGATAQTEAPVQDDAGAATGTFTLSPGRADSSFDPRDFDRMEAPLAIGRDLGERMTMPVEIGGSTYDFVIDTGSQRTIVATELARRLALPEGPAVEIVSMAGRVTVSSVALAGLRFGDHLVENVDALSIRHQDLGGAGLIGLDSLRDKRLTLDFKARRMDVGKSRRAKRDNDPNTIVVEGRTKLGQLILVDSRIDGRRVNVILDTGAEVSVGNMALFRSLKLKRLVIPPQPTSIISVTGVQVPAQYTVVKQLRIGSVTLNNVPMVFLDAAPFAELGLAEKPAMLLGMRMLRMFERVAIDFGNRHVDFHLPEGAERAGTMRLASLDGRFAAMPATGR